jgi:hypothetical protein
VYLSTTRLPKPTLADVLNKCFDKKNSFHKDIAVVNVAAKLSGLEFEIYYSPQTPPPPQKKTKTTVSWRNIHFIINTYSQQYK